MNIRPIAFPTLSCPGGTVQFDRNASPLERVHLKEHFARGASHSRLVNFGDGCIRGCCFPDHKHVPDLHILGKRQGNLVTHLGCL